MNQNPIFPLGPRYRPALLKSGVLPLTLTFDPAEPAVGWTLIPYGSGRGGVGQRAPEGGGEPRARKATPWFVAGPVDFAVTDTPGLPVHEPADAKARATTSTRVLTENMTGGPRAQFRCVSTTDRIAALTPAQGRGILSIQ